MIRVFISYSTKDLGKVVQVVKRLDDSGIFTFFAAVDVRPGMDLMDWMQTSLRESTHLILFWSLNAASSNWVKEEWQARFWEAVERGSRSVIPILLDNTPLPIRLRRI